MDTEREQLKEYRFVYEALDDKKGLDIMGIYLGEASYIADIFILVTANSDIHMNTLRDTAMEALKSRHTEHVEGRESLQWCLVDRGNVASTSSARRAGSYNSTGRLPDIPVQQPQVSGTKR